MRPFLGVMLAAAWFQRDSLIENLSETNPLLINEEKVLEPRLLHDGDRVKIGNSLFRFVNEENQAHLNPSTATEATLEINVEKKMSEDAMEPKRSGIKKRTLFLMKMHPLEKML